MNDKFKKLFETIKDNTLNTTKSPLVTQRHNTSDGNEDLIDTEPTYAIPKFFFCYMHD